MKEMTVTIDKDGKVSIDTKGFVGTDCDTETRKMVDELGSVISKDRKPEYYSKVKKIANARLTR